MLLPLVALGLLISAPTQASTDQTADALLLINFLGAVKRGSDTEAVALLGPGAFIGDYRQSQRTSFAEFAKYARGCKLSKVTLAPIIDGRMPIGVQWFCGSPEGDRNAAFWFEGERISRIGWGKPPVIKVTLPKQQ